MDFEAALLCDAATDQGGKLNVLGAFDTIHTRGFPTTHPQCAIVYRIRFSRLEAGKHRVKVRLVTEDGEPVIPPLEAELNISLGPGGDSAVSNLVLNLQQLTIAKPGRYSVDLSIDGRQEKSIPLTVVKM
ncbi:MAG TPA: hypothetical protein PK280_11040 [Planctomycetota bacterium]|nr:hypothetical protein [Planctomycetota bacterium]